MSSRSPPPHARSPALDAGVEQATGGQVTYVHAAEPRRECRAVLRRAYGLTTRSLHMDARSDAARTAPRTSVHFATPDCGKMSARNHHRSCSTTAEGVAEASENLGFLENGRSDIAIIENVAGRGVVEVRPAQPRPPCARLSARPRHRHSLLWCAT